MPKGAKWRAVAGLRLLDGTSKRVEAWGKSRTAAQNAFTTRCRELLGPDAATLSNRTLFGILATVYARTLDEQEVNGDRSPTTCDRYRTILRLHVLPALQHLELREITPGVLTRMLAAVKSRGIGAPTRRHIRVVVGDALQLAVDGDALATNPAKQLARIRSDDKALPRALTPAEQGDLLAKLRGDTYAVRSSIADLVIFMLGTGCRIAEALAVRWRDLDLVGVDVGGRLVPVAYLGPVVVTIKGKGLVRREKGKTGRFDGDGRHAALPSWTVDMLALRRPEWATDDDPVFWAQPRRRGTVQPVNGAGYRSPQNVHRTWRETRKRHGYEWVSPHVFRKTAITEMQRSGMDSVQIADVAGHRQVSMTQNTYFGRNTLHPEAANRPIYDGGSPVV